MSPAGLPRLYGTGMARQAPGREHRPYRRLGDPGWTPEGLGPIASPRRDRQAEREARIAEFTRLREAGWPAWRAAACLGISRTTASAYERERLRRQRGGGRP